MFFTDLKLKRYILDALAFLKVKELTKIQEQVLPYALYNNSVIVTSQTGTGKTFCYLLPILNSIDTDEKRTQALIVLPTKELARQVNSKLLEFKEFNNDLRITLLVGNSNLEEQKRSLKNNPPQIIIGTTVRIMEMLQEKIIDRKINIIALDEVDMLMDAGFSNQIDTILNFIDNDKLQKIACSATLMNLCK